MRTVGELISELESFPKETPVIIHKDKEGTASSVSIGFIAGEDNEPVCVILSPSEEDE